MGTKYGRIRTGRYCIQKNNSTEFIVRAAKADLASNLINLGVPPIILNEAGAWKYLESCGGESVANCCNSLMEVPWNPITPGGWEVPVDDIVMGCFNNPDNAALMKAALPGFDGVLAFENRYMPLHPVVAKLVFGIVAVHKKTSTFEQIRDYLDLGHGVGIHLKGHYVAGVDFDHVKDIIIINDSWGDRKPEWKGDGFNQSLDRIEYASAYKEIVVYYKPIG
jgi:hypothetical protein